jgi:Tol biopolymer transport system component
VVQNRSTGARRTVYVLDESYGKVPAGSPGPRIGMTLAYTDYMTWCSGRLVFTGGGNRLATTNKRLLVASAPTWQARPLVKTPKRAWGWMTCAPDGRSLAAQSQPASENYNFFATSWELWRVGMNGSQRRLTSPPLHSADESPRFSRDGRSIFFVRSRRGIGQSLRAPRRTALRPTATDRLLRPPQLVA